MYIVAARISLQFTCLPINNSTVSSSRYLELYLGRYIIYNVGSQEIMPLGRL